MLTTMSLLGRNKSETNFRKEQSFSLEHCGDNSCMIFCHNQTPTNKERQNSWYKPTATSLKVRLYAVNSAVLTKVTLEGE